MPGESPAVFGDALRRLASSATYLYQDGSRYWYSTQPTVTKLADDRAEQLKRDTDKVVQELDRRLRSDLRRMGDFRRVHPMPSTSADVPDDMEARLIVLGVDHSFNREADNPAESHAKKIFEQRGNTPRLYRNTLVFLAADKSRLQDLDEAVRKYLAWESILHDKTVLDLSPHQVRQAETQKTAADGMVIARLPETYQWLLVPTQSNPQDAITWQAIRLTGQDALAERASKKLKNDELLITNFAPSRLRMEMDKIPLWRGNHVSIRQLIEDFARYLYLPRIQAPGVLLNTIRVGLALLTWEQDAFAYADSFDEPTSRYRGLRPGGQVTSAETETGLLVLPQAARDQIQRETVPSSPDNGDSGPRASANGTAEQPVAAASTPAQSPKAKRYHGTVQLDPARVGRDAGRIADEVITHLVGLMGSKVTITLEIQADIPSGAPDNVVRTVTENSRTLKFGSNSGFETE